MYEDIIEVEEIFDELIQCDLDEAFKYCIDGLKETSKLEFLLFAGKVHLMLEEYINAIAYVDMAIQLGCDYYIYGLKVKGEAYYNLGLYQDSKKCFFDILNYEPENYFAITFLIDIAIIEGDYVGAINIAVDYIEEYNFDKKQVGELMAIIGWLYLEKLDDLELAKDAFEEGLVLDENCSRAYTGLAYYYFKIKDYEKAVKYFIENKEINSDSGDSAFGMALCYKELGQYDKIENYLIEANMLEPDNISVLIEYGYEMIRQEKEEDAIDIFNQIIDIDPKNNEIKQLIEDLRK